MILSNINKNDLDIITKKTKATQENEANSNSGNDKQGKEQENQLFNYKVTENNIKEYSNNHKRQDKYGNPITKKGNQKVTFIDISMLRIKKLYISSIYKKLFYFL